MFLLTAAHKNKKEGNEHSVRDRAIKILGERGFQCHSAHNKEGNNIALFVMLRIQAFISRMLI